MPPRERRRAGSSVRLARAVVVPDNSDQGSLFDSTNTADNLLNALRSSPAPIQWRQRLWRFSEISSSRAISSIRSPVRRPPRTLIFGRLGFEREGVTTAVFRDSRFAQQAVPYGNFSPFAIDATNFNMVFQTRGDDIRVNSFASAFGALLRSTAYGSFRLESSTSTTTLSDWLNTVARVTRLHVRAELPNPNWRGRPQTEDLFAAMNLTSYTADFRGDDVRSDAEFARELIQHADMGYGEASADAERETNGSILAVSYQSSLGGETTLSERIAETEDGGAVLNQTLADELLSFGDPS
jgi:hypothetical protein